MVALSVMAALLGAAPFTPAIWMVVPLLPVAAVVAYQGYIFSAVVTLVICLAALALSPLQFYRLLEWPLLTSWVVLWSVAVVICAVRRGRAGA